MLQLDYLDRQEKRPNGPASRRKVSVSGRSPKFEKIQNSFSDMETASNR
jgi:hypothetical protein